MGISTHILDTTRGRPAQGVAVTLELKEGSGWRELARGVTDADGRVKPLLDVIPEAGIYRVSFDVAAYFARLEVESFYPAISIEFRVKAPAEHHHVPLLLNPFGFSTYRGS
ncbi:MAG: hydroxyisourate hydrolase [Myxococcaceae bacterium]